jgi:hypothetical protein
VTARRNVGTLYRLWALPLVVLVLASGCAAPPPSSTMQVFTGSTPGASQTPSLASPTKLDSNPNPCEQRVLRTITFTKKSGTTRLRISYKDTASVQSNNSGLAVIVGRIDNVPITNPTGLQMHFAMARVDNGFSLYNSSFTLIGYADGVAKGSHTLSFIYDNRQGPLGNIEYSCFVDSDPFFIEIVETS